jgi:glycosyltransferase involved in cell wall biosynthesis
VSARVFHFAQDSDTSGFFPQLARHHDRQHYEMFFGTLNPIAPWLRDYMAGQEVTTFSCGSVGRASYPLGLLRLARFLRRQRVQIVHTHLFEPSVIGLLAARMARVPVCVMTRHYSDYHTRIQKSWHVRLDQLCTGLSDSVIAVSRHTAEHMIAVEGAPAEKIHVVLNGIDFERIRISEGGAPARLRRELSGGATHLLLVAARLHPEKGYEYLFAALPRLRRLLTEPFRLLVAGTGAREPRYRDLVASLGCQDLVTFLGFRRDLPDLMAAVDLVVLPSVAEAFGLVLAEALYLGTPVVATRVGGIPEIVDDGIDGVLVPPADSGALATALAGLLTDGARRAAMGGRGRGKVMTRFRFEDMVGSYEKLYAALLDKGFPRGREDGA